MQITPDQLARILDENVDTSVDRDYPGTRDEIIDGITAAITALQPEPGPGAGKLTIPQTLTATAEENILGYALARQEDGVYDLSPVAPTLDAAKATLAASVAFLEALGHSSAKVEELRADITIVRITEVKG